MENAEAALVQGVKAIVCPFGLEKNRHREAIPQFALSTKPDSEPHAELNVWLPNAQPLGLQKWSP